MTKNKLLSLSVLGVGALLALAGCKGETSSSSSEESSSSEAHVHTAGTEWKHDETNHWHLCTGCGEKMDVAAHSFEDHVVAPTDDAQGYTEHVCACGYTVKDTYVDKEYEITFEGGDYAFALGLAEKSKAGETISFKVTLESGYEAYSVTASYGEGESATAVALTGSLQEGFTFTMPKAAVTIKAETRGAYFEVGPEDASAEVFKPEAKDASAKKVSDFIGGYIVDDKLVTGETTIYARAGATVRLLRNYVALAANTVYTVDGVALENSTYKITKTVGEGDAAKTEEHTYNVVEFVMPAHSANVEVSAEEKLIEFEVDAPDYVITSTYVKDADGNKTDATSIHAYAGSTYSAPDTAKLFLDVSLDGEHSNGEYKIDKVTCEYQTFSGYEVKAGTTQSTALSGSNGTYYYIPGTFTSYYGKLTLKVEVAKAEYAGADWVGTYGGVEIYGNRTSGTASASFDAFKSVSIGSYTKTVVVGVEEGETSTKIGVASSTTGTTISKYCYYDNNFMVAPYGVTSYSNMATDFYVLVKDKAGSDLNVTIDEGGKQTSTTAIFVKVSDKDGNELGNVLMAMDNFYLNVEVEFDEGYEHVNASSNFTIKKNGTKIAKYGVTDGKFGKIED